MKRSVAAGPFMVCILAILYEACGGGIKQPPNSNSGPTADTPTAPSPVIQPSGATGRQPASIMFIVDSSGSMKTSVGAKTKMGAAKEVVTDLVGKLGADVNAGLMAYGHRKKNECKDVEVLIPVGPLQRDAFIQKVNALQPLGETPISYSIQQAAESLKDVKGRKTIILISDGEETCHQDPCEVSAALKKADVDLQIHVVGFGIENEAARKQLHCIAEATGGVYKDAKDADELKSVVEGLAKSAETGNIFTTSLFSDGRPVEWAVEFFKAGTTERVLVTNASPPPFLPPGAYDAHYYFSNTITGCWKRNIVIGDAEAVKIEIPQAGRLTIKSNVNGAVIKAIPNDKDLEPVTFNTNQPQELLPGTYDLEMWGGLDEKRSGINISSSKETVIEINGQ